MILPLMHFKGSIEEGVGFNHKLKAMLPPTPSAVYYCAGDVFFLSPVGQRSDVISIASLITQVRGVSLESFL